MTDDIVERLRDKFRYGYPSWHQPCNEAMREAADEIERLRAAFVEILNVPEGRGDAGQMVRIARRALEAE